MPQAIETIERIRKIFTFPIQPSAKLLFINLISEGVDEAIKPQKLIAKETSLSISSIKKAQKILKDHNLIRIKSGKAYGVPNIYSFNLDRDDFQFPVKDVFALLPEGVRLLNFKTRRKLEDFYEVHLEIKYRRPLELRERVIQLAVHVLNFQLKHPEGGGS